MNQLRAKRYIFIVISVMMILIMSACGKKGEGVKTNKKITEQTSSKENNNENISNETADVINNAGQFQTDIQEENDNNTKEVEWQYDITHDGIEDTIKINIGMIENPVQDSKEKYSFTVYSGQTGNVIWKKDIEASHIRCDGIYLYNDGNQDYLLEWEPYFGMGEAWYHYKAFSLTDVGDENVIDQDEFRYIIENDKGNEDDIPLLIAFVDKVNNYLNKSFVLVDTSLFFNNDREDRCIYSTSDNKVVLVYDTTNDINKIKGFQYPGLIYD